MKVITADLEIDFVKMEKEHLNSWLPHLDTRLDTLRKKTTGKVKDFYEELYKYRKELLIERPDALTKIKNQIELLKSKISRTEQKKSKIHSSLKQIFDYPAFVNSYLPKWGAYKYVQDLKVRSCAYCNRTFTFTLDKRDSARSYNLSRRSKAKRIILKNITSSKTRPELDHFYPQGKFPYLALAIYNLIPVCHTCNSNLKGSREVAFDLLINPHEDDFDDIIKIKVKLRKEAQIQADIDSGRLNGSVKDYFGYNLFVGKLESFDLSFERVNTSDSELNTKAENHIELYALKELYEMHKDHVSRILKNAIRHGPSSAKDIYARHNGLFHSEEEARSTIMGTPCIVDKINEFPLSKLSIDITKDFNL